MARGLQKESIFNVLQSMQKETTVRKQNGERNIEPMYPTLHGFDFNTGCIDSIKIYKNALEEFRNNCNTEPIDKIQAEENEIGAKQKQPVTEQTHSEYPQMDI